MADSKVYVIAPREENGKLCGRVPLPLENTRELEMWYDYSDSAPYLYKFKFSADNRWLAPVISEYHYKPGLRRWVYEVDIDGHAVKIEVAMVGGSPNSTYVYPLDDILGCPSAYLTYGVLFVVRLQAAEQCAKSAEPSAQLPARSAKTTSNEDFLPQYDDQLLKSAGLTRQFLRRLWEIVKQRGVVKTAELAKALKLPKQSQRLGMALSILVQERLIYQKSSDSYSIHPADYQPAPEDMMWRFVKYVCDNPGADTTELVKAIGGDTSRLSRVARHLAAQGLIRRQLVVRRRGIADCATWLHYPAD